MGKVQVIGIGPGGAEHMTTAAIAALRSTDVLIGIDKGAEKHELVAMRAEIVSRYAAECTILTRSIQEPVRGAAQDDEHYQQVVQQWHDERAALIAAELQQHHRQGKTCGFLVWGDPSLYDSTLRILQRIHQDYPLDISVIPAVSAVHALTAAHKILLNRVGETITICAGRKLPALSLQQRRNVCVMLDAQCTFTQVCDEHTYIWWGAYVGTPQEVLRCGYAHEVSSEIQEVRASLKKQHGWVMDIYLLRQLDDSSETTGR